MYVGQAASGGSTDMDKDSGKVRLLMADDEFKASCAKEMALLALMEKTGYNMVQENGQRKYGGPPPGEYKDRSTQPEPASDQVQGWVQTARST